MEEFSTMDQSNDQSQDSFLLKFYEKLGEIYSQWIPLEDVFYRNSEIGDIDFGKVKELNKWPDLMFFNVAVAKNGGPIAFMIKDNVLFIGQKEIKSIIFIFTAFGKLLKVINLPQKLQTTADKLKWTCFQFTTEEDLCLVNNDGTVFLLDPMTGELKDQPMTLGIEFTHTHIVDTKLEDNLLVFRNTNNQFYWVSNITQNPVPNKFDYVHQLQNASISDYIVIPKNMSGTKNLELLVADQNEGFHLVRENKDNSIYLTDLSRLATDSKRTFESFGKISKIALNSKKDLLAFYSEPDSKGRIIVLKSDLSKEFNRIDTKLIDAKQLDWCGNDVTVLTYPDKVIMVGPNQFEIIDLKSKQAGIQCFTEIDGLRIITSEKTYFLERVQKSMIQTFKIASIEPSAKLLNAQKSVDLRIPRADEIIRDLGKKLNGGIECLLDAATFEHWNISVLKHLLKTASFAKKFSDPQEFDPNRYVNVVKHMIVLTKLRHSSSCGRAITFKQFEKFKAKNILKLLMKYREYNLAIKMIDILSLKQYLPQIYEEWCVAMLKHSTLNSSEIMSKLVDKFESLAEKLRQDSGVDCKLQIISLQPLYTVPQQVVQTGSQQVQNQIQGKPGMQQQMSMPPKLFQQLKLNIDFTKLAKIADQKGKQDIADFLISNEKSIVKKIPFLLEVKQYEKALMFAMDGGDPNIVNKVISEIFKKKDIASAVTMIASVPDGIRHLRNFAKKRKADELLEEVMALQKTTNYTPITMNLMQSYASDNLAGRTEMLRNAIGKLDKMKDDFYVKCIQEQQEVFERERQVYSKTRQQSIVDAPMSDLIRNLLSQGRDKEKELKEMKNLLKINERPYFMIVIRGFAEQNNWNDVTEFIKMKKPPISYGFLAEICHEYGNVPLAVEATKKISDYDEKITMLIDFAQWREAIEETFNGKRLEYLDDIRIKGPPFVEDFIREEQSRRQK